MSLNSSNNVAAASSSKLFQYKLVLLGESAVGKSSIATSLVKGKFDEVQESTIGAAFFTQTLPFEDHSVKFEIWDTAGQERYHSLAPMYYRGAQAAIVVYDLTKAESFDRAINWVKELQRQASSQIVIALVGNKLDLVRVAAAGEEGATAKAQTNSKEEEASSSSIRAVSVEQAKQIATKFGLLFWETSAKTGENVQAVFRDIAAKLPKTVPLNEMLFKSSSSLNRPVNLAGGASGEERTMKCC